MKYNPKIVVAFFEQSGIPTPELEWRFCESRKWRFDFAWKDVDYKGRAITGCSVALEVQGGIWTSGRHTRGAALLKEWEKINEAAILGWRIIYCQPEDLMKKQTVDTIKRAIGL
jgi:hypothetical protein